MQRKVEMMGVTYSSGADKGIAEHPITDADGDITMEPAEDILSDAEEDIPVEPQISPIESTFPPLLSPEPSDAAAVDEVSTKDDPSTDALKVACMETFEKLAILPPRSGVKITQALDVTPDGNLHYRDQAITSLELARQVRKQN